MDYDRLRELQEKFEQNPRRYFAPLANEYRKGGNPKRAIEICRAHLAQMPGHMSGQVVYGQALFEGGEYDEARKVFEAALVLDPENLIALRSLGDLSLQAGNTTEARNWYMRLLDADPKDTSVIALISEIDASLQAAPAPPADAGPAEDADRGEQQIPDADERPVETATAQSGTASADTEEATHAAPLGLERHYPTEAITPESDALDWSPPAGTDTTEVAAAGGEAEVGTPAQAAEEPEQTRPTPAYVNPNPEPFVNETMAQLYLQQGYKHLALKVYRQLAESRPNDQSLKDRIAEIEAAAREADAETETVARREEAPSVETPSPAPAAPRAPSIESPLPHGPSGEPASVETPSFDRSPVDSPPLSTPSREPDSIESPARDEPRAEPEGIAARQPSIREFFATLGRRRPPRPVSSSAGGYDDLARIIAAPPLPPPPTLDNVFAGAQVSQADSRAATTLAGAFSASARGATPPPPPASATPRSNPRLQTHESEEDVAKFRAWLDGLTGE